MGGANRPRVVDPDGEALLRDLIENNPECILHELCEAYLDARSVRVSTQTMSTVVRRLGFTRKRGLFEAWRPIGRT
jgi:transposase